MAVNVEHAQYVMIVEVMIFGSFLRQLDHKTLINQSIKR